MKYSLKAFEKEASGYKKGLRFLEKKTVLIELPLENQKAFYSLAPLSRALHGLKADLSVSVHGKKSANLAILEKMWNAGKGLEGGKKTKQAKALKEFVEEAEKKAGKGKIKKAFKEPDAWISAGKEGYSIETKKGIFFTEYRKKWAKERKTKGLAKTAEKILKYGFALKKGENFSVGFELVPAKKDQELPLEDYLDNFFIARAMAIAAKKKGAIPSLGAGTSRKSKTMPMNGIAELKAMVSGCEHDKKVKEPVFRKYSKLSRAVGAGKWNYADAVFSIVGKGYAGKHLFGTKIGYPSPGKKTRWPSPGSMFLKPWWNAQSSIDKRKPKMRYGLTETLPIENFIRTCDIDYAKMRKRNQAIKKAMEKSETIIVKGKKVKGGKTSLEVSIKNRLVMKSDSDARNKLNKQIKKQKGIIAGMYANYPGGEAFITPESISGTAVGDVVINIDQSYVIKNSHPFIVEFKKGKWKIKKAPPELRKKIESELRDVKKLIREYRENKALPKKITRMYSENMKRVGEFAINTNPSAKLSNYLIENEKIARMIHIALGSGFEPDRQTLYHWDFVLNSPRQKLDIYGLGKNGEKHWIIRKGKFAL